MICAYLCFAPVFYYRRIDMLQLDNEVCSQVTPVMFILKLVAFFLTEGHQASMAENVIHINNIYNISILVSIAHTYTL